ncbi:hypothetical protein Tsp_03072 [Trichinella spiralis]|uniref:hypothetical protein n=1 Tax=Trichinella spiralis TaxID=6334 RepID=UPI0001EFB7F3|nr:hypothetical protein Tsp_03072 [Trichinella spiralis]
MYNASAFHFCVCVHVNEVVLLVLAITCTVSIPACTHHLRIVNCTKKKNFTMIDFLSFNITTALLFVVAVICALCGFFLSTLVRVQKEVSSGRCVFLPFIRSALSLVHFLQATSEVVRGWCSHWDRSFLIGFVMDIDHAIVSLNTSIHLAVRFSGRAVYSRSRVRLALASHWSTHSLFLGHGRALRWALPLHLHNMDIQKCRLIAGFANVVKSEMRACRCRCRCRCPLQFRDSYLHITQMIL